MKNLKLTLVILAAIFIYQIEAISNPSDTLDYLKETVNETLEFLSNYEYQSAVDGDKQFRELFYFEGEAISKDANDTIQLIQKKIEEAGIEGSLARVCNRSAVLDLLKAQDKIMAALYECFSLSSPNYSDFYERIKVSIKVGEDLLDKFTKIRENCTSELVNEELCIVRQLSEAKSLAASYEVNVAYLKEQAAAIIAKGFDNVAVCIRSPLDIFKFEVDDIISTLEECIKSV